MNTPERPGSVHCPLQTEHKKDKRIASQDSSLRPDIWILHLLNMKHECLDRAIRLLCNNVNPLTNSTEKSLSCETSTQTATNFSTT